MISNVNQTPQVYQSTGEAGCQFFIGNIVSADIHTLYDAGLGEHWVGEAYKVGFDIIAPGLGLAEEINFGALRIGENCFKNEGVLCLDQRVSPDFSLFCRGQRFIIRVGGTAQLVKGKPVGVDKGK